MIWNEHHHAWIVSDYYRLLLEQFGAAGKRAFVQAAQTYGEQRGKRMAMRAIADGRPLGLLEYFAYGEYPSTDAFFEVDMWGETGVVPVSYTHLSAPRSPPSRGRPSPQSGRRPPGHLPPAPPCRPGASFGLLLYRAPESGARNPRSPWTQDVRCRWSWCRPPAPTDGIERPGTRESPDSGPGSTAAAVPALPHLRLALK